MPLLCTSCEELLPMALLRAQEQADLPPLAPPASGERREISQLGLIGERREISQLGLIGTLMVQAPAGRRPSALAPARS